MMKLQNKYNELNAECKDNKLKYNELKIKYDELNNNIGVNHRNFIQWSSNDIVDWIMTLDNNRFKRYEKKLKKNLKKQNFDGECLNNLQKSDIADWGIYDFRDKTALFNHIQYLINKNNENYQHEFDEGGNITAYM